MDKRLSFVIITPELVVKRKFIRAIINFFEEVMHAIVIALSSGRTYRMLLSISQSIS